MRYFVVGMDGKTYGPVDIQTLRAWIREGRVRSDTELREEEGTVHIRAGLVPELEEMFSQFPQVTSSIYPNPPCRNCGQPYDQSRPVCPNCGASAFVPMPGRLLTGGAIGDRILGFTIGFFSWFLYGIGAFVCIILYFVLKPNYPSFARGIGFGLLTVLVILLGLIAVCFVGLTRL